MSDHRPTGIDCPDWTASPTDQTGRRCDSYVGRGGCLLDGHDGACCEWVRRNPARTDGEVVPVTLRRPRTTPTSSDGLRVDPKLQARPEACSGPANGNEKNGVIEVIPIAPRKTAAERARELFAAAAPTSQKVAAALVAVAELPPRPPPLTDAQVDDVRRNLPELSLRSEQLGDIEIVPKLTGRRDAVEITFDQIATLERFAGALGARIVGIRTSDGRRAGIALGDDAELNKSDRAHVGPDGRPINVVYGADGHGGGYRDASGRMHDVGCDCFYCQGRRSG